MSAASVVHGSVAPGFEPVAEAFAANFAEHGEVGAAFAVTLDGEPVVDLWGGVADSAARRPWERDTAVVLFSGTKGLVALCLLMPAVRTPLADEDLLDGERISALLAAQPQETDPRVDPFVYHPLTYGWLLGELIRRVDGRSVGRFFAEEVAGPLGLDAWIGVDAALEPRIARLKYGSGMDEIAPGVEAAGDELRNGALPDPRAESLLAALHRSVARC